MLDFKGLVKKVGIRRKVNEINKLKSQ